MLTNQQHLTEYKYDLLKEQMFEHLKAIDALMEQTGDRPAIVELLTDAISYLNNIRASVDPKNDYTPFEHNH